METLRKLDINPDLLRRYTDEIQKSQKEHETQVKAYESEFKNTKKEGWSYYASPLGEGDEKIDGRSGYFNPKSTDSFDGLGGFSETGFVEYIDGVRQTHPGQPILILDAFGQGVAFADIADQVVSTSFAANPGKPQNVTEFTGDALSAASTAHVYRHLRTMAESGFRFPAAFFRPVAGLFYAESNIYAFHRLYEQLEKTYNLIDNGGLIFVQSFRQSTSSLDIEVLEKILGSEGYQSLFSSRPSHWPVRQLLIKKDLNICKRLPSIVEIGVRHPEIIETLLDLAKGQPLAL